MLMLSGLTFSSFCSILPLLLWIISETIATLLGSLESLLKFVETSSMEHLRQLDWGLLHLLLSWSTDRQILWLSAFFAS